jgi:hypothetical protein
VNVGVFRLVVAHRLDASRCTRDPWFVMDTVRVLDRCLVRVEGLGGRVKRGGADPTPLLPSA